MKSGDGLPRSNSRRMTRVISCRFTPDEIAAIAEAAANDDYARPALWMRDLVMEEVGRPGRIHRVLPTLICELRPIGLDINRIAHMMKRSGYLSVNEDLHRHMAEMSDLFARIGRAIP